MASNNRVGVGVGLGYDNDVNNINNSRLVRENSRKVHDNSQVANNNSRLVRDNSRLARENSRLNHNRLYNSNKGKKTTVKIRSNDNRAIFKIMAESSIHNSLEFMQALQASR